MKSLSKWFDTWQFFSALSLLQQGLLLRALFVMAAYKILLRICPFRWFLRTPSQPPPTVEHAASEPIANWVWAITAASNRVPLHFTCLVQALSLKFLLRKYPDLRVHIGVHKADSFLAHAWVTYQGRTILGGNTSETYAPILDWM